MKLLDGSRDHVFSHLALPPLEVVHHALAAFRARKRSADKPAPGSFRTMRARSRYMVPTALPAVFLCSSQSDASNVPKCTAQVPHTPAHSSSAALTSVPAPYESRPNRVPEIRCRVSDSILDTLLLLLLLLDVAVQSLRRQFMSPAGS